MTSMFDQYDTAQKREQVPVSQMVNATPTSSGFVSLRTKEETPIFSKRKLPINLPHDILFTRVCNNWLVVLMSHNVLLRLYLQQTDRQDEVFLEKHLTGLRVSNIFLDPTGNHLLIALATKCPGFVPELLYLHRKSNKPKKIEKFRDHEITAVAFNHNNQSEASTGSILIGTSKGMIFETEFGIEGEKMFQSNWKQVFDIGKGEHCPITGIEFYKVPNTSRYIVLASTLNRLYKFHENLRVDEKPPYLQHIFQSYLNVPEDIKDFHQINNKLKYSKLRVNYDKTAKFPKSFGWLTDIGIYTGEIDQQAESPQFILTNEVIPYPETPAEESIEVHSSSYTSTTKKQVYPISFIQTDFHVLLLYSDHVTAVSLLNYQIVYEEYFAEQLGKFVDVTRDITSNAIFASTGRNIFRFKVTNEHRHVWILYLEKNEFEMAKLYCHDNAAQLDMVLVKQAELKFSQKDYMASARIYSETQTSFEDVCLKFMEINEYEALLVFLKNRLDKLDVQDKTQISMLVVWIVELYLTQMARCSVIEQQAKIRKYQMEFDAFMKTAKVVECVRNNRTVIYDLMASHGDNFNLNTLTAVNKDFESVLDQYINQGKFKDAVSVLNRQTKPELFYKYCPMLMEEIPRETIDVIIGQGRRLNPIELLPTLICQDTESQRNETIRYLDFCTVSLGCTDQAIHNFLVKLYTQHKSGKLMTYFELQGKDISLVHYDVHYALRVCAEHNAIRACVFLQCLLELWHPAVELALTFDTKLAQQTASQPSDRELQRKLWLLIAEHEIKGKNDVKQALDLLKECDLLRIEDLLPFFDDFQKIDHFKEVICDALKEYNAKIQEQRIDMEESAKSAERVRNELQTFRNRSIVIDGQELCAICSGYLQVKPFFIFPCGHKFHHDCLEHQIMEHLSNDNIFRLSKLKQQLQTLSLNIPVTGQADANPSQRDNIKNEIETILAAECFFCGEHMINQIDKPFIEDWDRVNLDWQ
ncbi:vacuolar protein sorting-associated protein 18 homolog isoform X2 [Contarinia nasturtii]|uniref:vacuolar protein sorting-associated protein 18 homolog isoform X2 n=1 Tax=Contarinia nasturtii TaxID=265458 RepID=UPI0012D41518|nr:vacuolar protein sorting-associated protein 18 homolog isoform X2 [Contarinia nasturtii]